MSAVRLPLRLFQKRFDEAVETVSLTFTDLLILAEQLATRVDALEQTVAAQAAQIAAQQRQIELLQQQVAELTARLDGRQ